MPATQISGQVGPQQGGSGTPLAARQGNQGDIIVSELHGQLYEANFRNGLFSGGMTLTAISNVTFTTGTLGATCTPILGVWNPLTSQVNLVVLQAVLSCSITALQNTGGAPFVWAASFLNGVITTGAAPFNRKTLQANGSAAKNMSGVALTGLTNNLVVLGAAALGGGSSYNIATLSTAAGFNTVQIANLDNVNGAFIVPPGGVLALLATTTPVGLSAASSLLWEEVNAGVI